MIRVRNIDNFNNLFKTAKTAKRLLYMGPLHQQFQQNPLMDTYNRQHNYLRISLTERCNLRCQYCMPKEGVKLTVKSNLLTTDEILKLTEIFAKNGVNKIRLTGGEPTVRKDLNYIIESISAINKIQIVAMTTNGLTLTKQLVSLQKAGLNLLNISLDTLKPEKYQKITHINGFKRVIMGIDLALQLGYNPLKINCVIIKGLNDMELIDFVEFTKDRNVDIRFIEYMPFSGNKWHENEMISYRDMLQRIKNSYPNIYPLKNAANDTSKAWKIPGYSGKIGFITSMSENFCGSCNRLRLTADGNLKVCLFGNAEISLRDALRANISKEDLMALVQAAVRRKKKQHAGIPLQSNIPKGLLNLSHLFYKSIQSNITAIRRFSSNRKNLTHIDENGKAIMVDIADKPITIRTARATATVKVGAEITKLISENAVKKGDVLSLAQISGIIGAKKTAEIIPLCHNISLTKINVTAALDRAKQQVVLLSEIQCEGRTGVEMEALTAVSIAALTVYDMCKAVSRDIQITDMYLLSKTGGVKSGSFVARQEEEFYVRDYDHRPITRLSPFVGPV